MREERVILKLDNYDHGMVIKALNDKRNKLLKERRDPAAVENLLLKTIDAPSRKVRVRDDEAR